VNTQVKSLTRAALEVIEDIVVDTDCRMSSFVTSRARDIWIALTNDYLAEASCRKLCSEGA